MPIFKIFLEILNINLNISPRLFNTAEHLIVTIFLTISISPMIIYIQFFNAFQNKFEILLSYILLFVTLVSITNTLGIMNEIYDFIRFEYFKNALYISYQEIYLDAIIDLVNNLIGASLASMLVISFLSLDKRKWH